MDKNLNHLFELCMVQINEIILSLNQDRSHIESEKIVDSFDKLQKFLLRLQNEHFKNLKKGTYKCKEGIIYSDLYNDIAKIGNYAFEINKLLAGISLPEHASL
jgi:Na+/phosphate symporter